jgi:hypothetical protein
MVAGASVDRHDFVPRSEGGKLAAPVHRVCHRKLHSLWNERELATSFNTPEAICSHPEIGRFVRWLRRKPSEFWVATREAKSKRA